MLPDEVMKEGLALAANAWFYGQPMESLTREELLACAALGWAAECKSRNERLRELGHLIGEPKTAKPMRQNRTNKNG